jgi:hypothetical protein
MDGSTRGLRSRQHCYLGHWDAQTSLSKDFITLET